MALEREVLEELKSLNQKADIEKEILKELRLLNQKIDRLNKSNTNNLGAVVSTNIEKEVSRKIEEARRKLKGK